jgi:hypothetical protein
MANPTAMTVVSMIGVISSDSVSPWETTGLFPFFPPPHYVQEANDCSKRIFPLEPWLEHRETLRWPLAFCSHSRRNAPRRRRRSDSLDFRDRQYCTRSGASSQTARVVTPFGSQLYRLKMGFMPTVRKSSCATTVQGTNSHEKLESGKAKGILSPFRSETS